MTSGRELIAAAAAVGVELRLGPDGRIEYRPAPFPPEASQVIEQIRAHRADVAAALAAAPPSTRCPAGHPPYWWRQHESDPWRCGRCEPDPRAARWQGVTLATLGDRRITLTAPSGDLPVPREWVGTPAGVADLLCWTDDGAEGLVRLFHPRNGQCPFIWFPAARIVGEVEWARRERRA